MTKNTKNATSNVYPINVNQKESVMKGKSKEEMLDLYSMAASNVSFKSFSNVTNSNSREKFFTTKAVLSFLSGVLVGLVFGYIL